MDDEDLKRVAEAATPGPWKVTKDECAACGGEWDIYDIPGGDHAKFELEADATYIATFDPPTVLSLLSRLSAAADRERVLVEALTPFADEFGEGIQRDDSFQIVGNLTLGDFRNAARALTQEPTR